MSNIALAPNSSLLSHPRQDMCHCFKEAISSTTQASSGAPFPESRLRRLPPELRASIYTFVLTTKHETVEEITDETGAEVEVTVIEKCARMGPEAERWHRLPLPHIINSCLTFLQTCHQVYAEAYQIFYKANTLVFDDLIALYKFQMTLSLARRAHLTSVHILTPIADPADLGWTSPEERGRPTRGIRMLQVSDLKRLTINHDRERWDGNVPFLELEMLRGLEEVNMFYYGDAHLLRWTAVASAVEDREIRTEFLRRWMTQAKAPRTRSEDLFQLLKERKREEQQAELKRKREESRAELKRKREVQVLDKRWQARLRPKKEP